MVNFDDEFSEKLKHETWSSYAVGMLIIVIRLYARASKLGITNLQADDYLMLVVAGLYTVLIVTLNTIAEGGGSNLYPPGLETTFTPAEINERILGSKLVIVSEQAMLNVIYTLKTCMLLFYTRLTLGLRNASAHVRWLALYVALGYVATQLVYFLACRPFTDYWAVVPPPDQQCATLARYAMVQGAANISADVLMLGIPVPLIVRMRLPWRQKVVLVVIFSLGVFVVIAALLTKVFNLSDVYNPNYMLWYVREASVAVYVANLPMIWPLLREWFPVLKTLTPAGFGRSRYSRSGRKGRRAEGNAVKMIHGASLSSTPKNPVNESIWVVSSLTGQQKRMRSPSPLDDIEKAMAEHGVGRYERNNSLSDAEQGQSRSLRGGSRNGSEAGAKIWQMVRPKSPARVLTKPRAVYQIGPNNRPMQMEQEASKGIMVQTVVSVREEKASPQTSREIARTPW